MGHPAKKKNQSNLLTVGYSAEKKHAPDQEALFQAFQSNLLSLISHELRTPLTGIINSLSILDEVEDKNSKESKELFEIAKKNAHRLKHSLSVLLDLAQIEGGVFHARLREVVLSRLVKKQADELEKELKEKSHYINITDKQADPANFEPLLADPKKLSRMIDLCLYLTQIWKDKKEKVSVDVSSNKLKVSFFVKKRDIDDWNKTWIEAFVGSQSKMFSAKNAFSCVFQSEKSFLTRSKEGLGSELMLIHELAKLHQAKFLHHLDNNKVTLEIVFPLLETHDQLKQVLLSRAFDCTSGLHSVALVLIPVPEKVEIDDFKKQVRAYLFRSSDIVYSLKQSNQVAIVLEDCKQDQVDLVMKRVQKEMGYCFHYAKAHCPDDESLPENLYESALKKI